MTYFDNRVLSFNSIKAICFLRNGRGPSNPGNSGMAGPADHHSQECGDGYRQWSLCEIDGRLGLPVNERRHRLFKKTADLLVQVHVHDECDNADGPDSPFKRGIDCTVEYVASCAIANHSLARSQMIMEKW